MAQLDSNSSAHSYNSNKAMFDYLIEQKGIGSNFVDAWGKPTDIKISNQLKILRSMGYEVDNIEQLESHLEDEIVSYWLTPLAPVVVNRVNESLHIQFRVTIDAAAKSHTLKIKLESGEVSQFKFVPVDYPLLQSQQINDIEFHEYAIDVPAIETLGYHELQILVNRKIIARTPLIAAPQACYIPNNIQQGQKMWGLSVQLYCVKSSRNWGIGDFSDLNYLVSQAAKLGADFIGLNPIHALYPANPSACSPYGPSSRLWLNYLYIDVESVPGANTDTFTQWMKQSSVQQKLVSLRDTEYVDYEGVADVKLAALQIAFDEFTRINNTGPVKDEFDAFVKAGGKSLQTLACFEALQMHLKEQNKPHWGWPVFPEDMQNADDKAVTKFAKKYKDKVAFFLFLQWQSLVQFEQAGQIAINAGMNIGLYRDLAVGVSEGGAEIWGNKDLYCADISVGAPPDILGPLGQKWGLPPMNPSQLTAQQYQPIIELFSSNMHASGALRIDHVMALLRLWWVHQDDDATDGVYVNYPVDELLAILALESVRHKSLVIGEDLGTVPDSIREKLQQNGMYSYRVFFFEQAKDGGFFSPSHYPEQSMATLTTHDMPTLIGFWHCDDLALGKELGLYPDDDVLANLYDTRHENKQHILDTLHGHHSISDAISKDVHYVGMTKELNFGMQTHMAGGSSALLSLQLEDWLEMDKPVNIPGTFNEYPNWKRKLSLTLEEIFAKEEVHTLTAQLNQKRQQASY
ncbi:4-alpha-glucanotransferase [Glaciecola sp. 2405UD65-10]|uniref:4-alpha-glucanotransferase n=1 Tax=Glaciecola sp. 2405UD65-10 TaxID=3397244 RepID=UPI003B5AF459